ncbi:MAG TPA: hypothetical protein ENK26_03290 [Gammaproteobacteria bacterium]|nr:hypothetical protein [Gammaproteobacteria bacterium]
MALGRELLFFARPKKSNQKKGRPRRPLIPASPARLCRSACTRIPARTSLNRTSCPIARVGALSRRSGRRGRKSLTARRASPDIAWVWDSSESCA